MSQKSDCFFCEKIYTNDQKMNKLGKLKNYKMRIQTPKHTLQRAVGEHRIGKLRKNANSKIWHRVW